MLAAFLLCLPAIGCSMTSATQVRFETVVLAGEPTATVHLAYASGIVGRHPVILMTGSLKDGELPGWSTGLVGEGFMLAAFTVAHPPDPDPERRPQWLVFDERFAHGYSVGGARAPGDTARVIDYLVARGDVAPGKIGWLGSSSTGIPGLAVAAREPRLAAIVAFVSTGAYRMWFDTWKTNGLWCGKSSGIWPDTDLLLKENDPIHHVDGLFPTAVLLVCGGRDKVVDPSTSRAFVEAAEPYYRSDPARLRLVVYENFAHNLPPDVVRMHAEHWFRLYMNPVTLPPKPAPEPTDGVKATTESVRRTQINAADHREVVGVK